MAKNKPTRNPNLVAVTTCPERDIETAAVGSPTHDAPGVFRTTSNNPNPSRVTDAMWWLWLRLHELEPGSELGGFYAFKRGYHSTRNDNRAHWPGDYSIRETEDQGGPGDKSAAIDWTFPDAQNGHYGTINRYCQRLMASGRDRNDPRLDGMREWYGQTNSDSHVEGWDCRHLVTVTSDSSHLWHIHMSIDRDKTTSMAVMDAILSVLRGETVAAWKASAGQPPVPPTTIPVPTPDGIHKPGTRTLTLADPQLSGDDVVFVQRWIGPAQVGPADGIYGPGTVVGVRWYQQLRHIGVDGEVGPETWAQMGIRMAG